VLNLTGGIDIGHVQRIESISLNTNSTFIQVK